MIAVLRHAGTVPAERPRDELARIRSQAKKHGLSIRRQRRTQSSAVERFSLIDKASRALLNSDINGLDELRNEIWWEVRKRTLAPGELQPSEAPRPTCPNCGTPRVGFLRLCRVCGLEFEATDPELRIAPEIRSVGSSKDVDATIGAPRSGVPLKVVPSPATNRLGLLSLLGLILAAAFIGVLVPLFLWVIQG